MDSNGYVYIKIKKGMYGLKQAAILAYQRLVELLQPNGYFPEPNTTGIWSHETRQTKFTSKQIKCSKIRKGLLYGGI